MTEPRRLLSDPQGGLEAELLRAGAAEEPSPRAVERTVVAVSAGAATLGVVSTAASAPAAVAATASTSLGVAGVTKLLVIGAVAGLASGGALLGVTKAVESRTVIPAPVASPATTVAEAREAPSIPAPPAAAPEAEPPARPPAEPPAVDPPAPRPSPPSATSEGTPLAEEVALVDRAHASLRSGDARGALATLAAYESAFTTPRLLPEVFALRMQASVAAGDDAAARLWAGRLVTRYPKSAQAARARALVEGPAEGDR